VVNTLKQKTNKLKNIKVKDDNIQKGKMSAAYWADKVKW